MPANNIIDRLQNGAIFEIPFLGEKGFGYIKLHKFYVTENGHEIMIPIFRVIDLFSETPIRKDINALENVDYTFVPLILLGIPKVRGKLGWKFKTNLSVKKIDEILPEFSFTMNVSALCGYNNLTINDVSWTKVTKLTMLGDSVIPTTFEQIKGLGFYINSASVMFNVRLTHFWNRKLKLGFDINKLLKDEGLEDFINMDMWNALIEIEAPMTPNLL